MNGAVIDFYFNFIQKLLETYTSLARPLSLPNTETNDIKNVEIGKNDQYTYNTNSKLLIQIP